MTTPLSLQNPQSKQERARFRTEQLERRPMPLVSTVPWILLQAGGQTLPGDGAFDPLLFDTLYWDPALVTLNPADPTDGSDSTFEIDVLTFGGTDYFQPTLRLQSGIEGFYRFEIFADVGDSGDGNPGEFWEVDVSTDTSGGAFPGTEGVTYAHIWNGTEFFEDVMRHVFHIWATAQRGYFMQSRQNTGAAKDLGGWMMIHYLGTLGGATDSAGWESASV